MGNKQLNKYHVIRLIAAFLTPAHSLLVYFIQCTRSARERGSGNFLFFKTLLSAV